MRITESSLTRSLSRSIQGNQKKIYQASNELVTGRKLQRPSDNPIASNSVERLRATSNRYQTYLEVSQQMEGVFDQAEAALRTSTDIVTRIREIGMSSMSGTLPDSVLEGNAELLEELKKALVASANTKFQDRYVFGGVADNTPPFDADGTFVGSVEVRTVEVGDQVSVKQVSGASVFAGQPDGINIMDAIDSLQAAMISGNQNDIQNALGVFQDIQDQLGAAYQELGNAFETTTQAASFAENIILKNTVQKASLQDTDVAETVSQLHFAQAAMEATTKIAQRTNNLQLFLNL